MSTAQVIAPTAAPTTSSAAIPRAGFSSIRTMFSTSTLKRHNIAQFPSSFSTATPRMVGSCSGVTTPSLLSPSTLSGPRSSRSSSVTKRTSMDKAAERDWKEQAKQMFQLSTVNDQGTFLPPTPMEKDFKDDLKKEMTTSGDYFETIIIRTPPEKVKTFLSTESTISPGMFSNPTGSKIKRHTLPSISTLTSSCSSETFSSTVSSQGWHNNGKNYSQSSISSAIYDQNNSSNHSIAHDNSTVSSKASSSNSSNITAPSSPSPSDELVTPPSSPSTAPAKDDCFMPSPPASLRPQYQSIHPQRQEQGQQQQQQPLQLPSPVQLERSRDDRASEARSRRRAQISFLTGGKDEEDDLSHLLVDPFAALLSSSPPSSSASMASIRQRRSQSKS
ncbi:hypothetical protein EDD11_009013 [Mortierella claussenii]|nr:hypothetical protein EDD11_009013 [Mortierella claussenii]